ncbi:MAG: helix-turn-helix domain-containing protein [Mogibacterium sp.]|nr:helix-turn-helix domain-containing protein [Mogibacterium sp.]
MKLNAEILYSELSGRYLAEFFRNGDNALTLHRPEFYMDDEKDFLDGHVYLATVEHLPQRPRIQRNAVLVCIGDSFGLNYYKDRLSLILIRSRADFFKVFRVLQEIFEKYEEWERSLYRDLIGDMDISGMISRSEEIFRMPIYVIDKSFRFVAASSSDGGNSWMQEGSETLNPESFSTFLSAANMMTERKNAFTLDIHDKPVMCVNLFTRNGEYAGCLCLDMKGAANAPGTDKLAEYLAGIIELAFERNPHLQSDSQASVKGLMQTLIEEMPLSRAQRVVLRSVNETMKCICIYFRSTERHQKMPLSYICSVIEEMFAGSYAFIYDDGIICLLNTEGIEGKDGAESATFNLAKKLRAFCRQMRLCAGVSGEFSDLFNTRVHFLQAQSALEDGRLLNPDDTLFYFSSYALTEMIINSLGGLPAEAYFPEGLKALLEHDRKSPVSYLETLRVFLEENLSYTSTAQKLFIHRSTLIDRIERIEREMKIDLKNSEQRLQLEMLLKAMDLEEVMRNR